MSKIFVTRPIPNSGLVLLEKKGHDVAVNRDAINRPAFRDEIISGVRGVDAILSVLTEKIDAEVMDAGKPSLKIIANYAVGYDNIDVEAAKERNILVTNTPGILTNTVAEHTFSLMLSIAHRIPEGDRYSRAGKYKTWGPELLLGSDLSGKKLGIIGTGRIGSRVAEHGVKGFGMQLVYNDIKPNKELEDKLGAEYFENVDDLLSVADFVSIHVPLLEATKHLINKDRLDNMKNTAYLVNTSRGPVIDEKALADALKEGQIKGAAIDVFEFEPKITPELLELDNIIMTPHIASGTVETRNKMSEMAAINIIDALEGKTPINLIK